MGGFNGSVCVVTGGTGSIGLELTRALLKEEPDQVRLFSNDENGLFESQSLFQTDSRVTYRLGDVRNRRAVKSVTEGADVVFHAAALKHVNFCESNPYEAIMTNVIGTQNIIDSVIENSVGRFILISTDKAVNPTSTMGTTKLLCEKLTVNASRITDRTKFNVVRFGNVLGSRGSVVVIFRNQVLNGEPITVTNPKMTRFVMLPSDSARMVLDVAQQHNSGKILVLKMKAVRIGDLVEACLWFFKGHNRAVNIIGARLGEKTHEELMTQTEASVATDIGDMYVIDHGAGVSGGYTSDSVELLRIEDIRVLLERLYPK